MAFLLDDRFQEIAALREAYNRPRNGPNGAPVGGRLSRLITNIGFTSQVDAEGSDSQYDVYALSHLIARGLVTAKEAAGYLSNLYPDQKWSGGKWGDLSRSKAEGQVIDSLGSGVDPDEPDLAEQAAIIQQSSGGGGISQTQFTASDNPVVLDDLPVEYNAPQIQELLDDVLGQVSASLDGISTGRIEYQANSIPGDAIAPGTISASRFNRASIRNLTSQVPSAEDAIILETAISGSADRWVEADGSRGPGRVLEVTRAILPPGYVGQPGPTRYRVVMPGMKFGVSSLFATHGATKDLSVSYGVVIRGIPHPFLREPIGITGVYAVGDSPVSFQFVNSTTMTSVGYLATSGRLFHDRADRFFATSGKPFAQSFGPDPVLAPSADSLNLTDSMSFSLLTGRTATEIYQQVNTRQGQNAARIIGNGSGPSMTLPNGGIAPSLTYPSMYDWNGSSQYNIRDESYDFAAAARRRRIVHGLPLRFDDCARLVPTDTEFSVVVQPNTLSIIPLTTQQWDTPAEWWKNGLQTTAPTGREWAIDIVVV